MRYLHWGTYGAFTMALVGFFVFFVGAQTSSNASGPLCTDPVSCVLGDETNGAYSQSAVSDDLDYLWTLLTQGESAYSATSPSGSSLSAELGSYDSASATVVENDLSTASIEMAIGDSALTGSAIAEASTGILLPVAFGTAAYVAYKVFWGSGNELGYVPITLPSTTVAADTADSPDVSQVQQGVIYMGGGTSTAGNHLCNGDTTCEDNFDFADTYMFDPPYDAGGSAPTAFAGGDSYTGTSVYDEFPGASFQSASPMVYDDLLGIPSSLYCPTADYSNVLNLASCNPTNLPATSQLADAIGSIVPEFDAFGSDTGVQTVSAEGGTAQLEYIAPSDLLTDYAGNPTYGDPGGETATVSVTIPTASTTPDPAAVAGISAFIADDPCVDGLLDHLMDSSYPNPVCSLDVPSTLLLPQPLTNQTCDDYVTSLATLGYTGDASCVTLDHDQAGYGPLSPVRMKITDPTTETVTTVDPLQWPISGPFIQPDAPITIQANPSGAPIVPGNGGGGNGAPGPLPTPIGGIGSPGCSCPPINMTPLEGLSLGDKFPFGVFTWAYAAIAPLDTGSGAAPDVTLTRPGGGTVDVNFRNTTWESYRPDLFLAVEFIMTFMAVVFLAVRVIGIGGGD